MDLRPGATIDGPNGTTITLGEVLGAGGFGLVLSGTTSDGTRVAVKTLLTGVLNAIELTILQNEIRQAVGFDHPNIVRVLHVDDGTTVPNRPPYIVMELVTGGTLRHYLKDRQSLARPLGLGEFEALYMQIAAGMQAISERLVHRDLKPENILMVQAPVTLKIADFGFAKLADAATRTHTLKGAGTLPYMAPEAWDGGPNTVALDVSAAGVIFFEMATFRLPVEPAPGDARGPLVAWRDAHLLKPPRDIRQLRTDLPPSLVQMIVAMLQKDPRKRPDWHSVRTALIAPSTAATGTPDVAMLLQRSVETSLRDAERETAARAAREAAAERTAVLHMAFEEVVAIADGIITAFNKASHLTRLELRRPSPLHVEIEGGTRQRRISIDGTVIEDLTLAGGGGVARLIAAVNVSPTPTPPAGARDPWDPASFGGFNLVYLVPSAAERFGWWAQFRFERTPLTGHASYPRWFAVSLDALHRELTILNVLGRFQHERRDLDDAWFKELIAMLL